jgi:hypothetical protein
MTITSRDCRDMVRDSESNTDIGCCSTAVQLQYSCSVALCTVCRATAGPDIGLRDSGIPVSGIDSAPARASAPPESAERRRRRAVGPRLRSAASVRVRQRARSARARQPTARGPPVFLRRPRSPGLWAPAPPAQLAQGRRDGRRDCPRVYLVPRRARTLGPGPSRARVPTLPSCDACLRARLPGLPTWPVPTVPHARGRPTPPALRLAARQ